MENGHPVTKAELEAVLKAALSAQNNDFHAALSAQNNDFHAALSAQKDELAETMRDIETNLLTEFHRYARGQQA